MVGYQSNNAERDVRYRAVITWRKVGPDYEDRRRQDLIARAPLVRTATTPKYAKTVDEWVEEFRKDDATIGDMYTTVEQHWDTIAPAKAAVTKQKRVRWGSNDRREFVSVQYQVAHLKWDDCDEKGN